MSPATRNMAGRAVFLDRDGTLNRDGGYVHRVDDLVLLDGVAEGLNAMQSMGYRLVIVTNQSGVGRGYFTADQLDAFNRALCERLAAAGVRIDGIYACTMHPEAALPEHRGASPCRKPGPGMLLEAADDLGLDLPSCWMVGDSATDVEAGRRAGCRTILIRQQRSTTERRACSPDATAATLIDAAEVIRRHEAIGPTSGRPRGSCP